MSRDSGRMPGTSSSECLDPPNSIHSARYDLANGMPFLPPPICCFIFARNEWICASNWLQQSWIALAELFLPWTRHTASAISTTETFSDSLTGQKIREVRPLLTLRSLPKKPQFAGGSYVIIQKYLHDMSKWNALSTEQQERIIGRKKLSDIELSDAVKAPFAHNVLTAVVENGKQVDILRDNMPFGKPGHGEFGTYFIGYCRTPRITEQMLQNMFIGNPPGNYDRLLDFSRAVTGSLFFAPSLTFLDNLGDDEPSSDPASTLNGSQDK